MNPWLLLLLLPYVAVGVGGWCFGRVSADADLRAETIHTERRGR